MKCENCINLSSNGWCSQYAQDIYESVSDCVNKVNENKDDEAISIYLRMFNKYRIIFDK